MHRVLLSAGVGCVLALAATSCSERQPARMYDGPELPRAETARIVVQPDRDGVLMRIESVDGIRAPDVEREFYDRDTQVLVRAGHHAVTVRVWAARVGPTVVNNDGEREELVRIATGESRILDLTAEGGHDYEIRTWRAPFDPDARQVTVPQRPIRTEEWLYTVDELSRCPECR